MNTETKTPVRNAGAITVALSKINVREDMLSRTELSDHHLKQLRMVVKRGDKFPPLLVWQERDDDGKPTGRLVLLDGRHRLAALRKEKPRLTQIEVRIFCGTKQAAIIEATGENTKAVLPLTQKQATDKAWQAVREDPQQTLSKAQISRKCAVSQSTVATMRRTLKAWPAGEDIPASWSKAQGFETEAMTDAQRNHMIREGSKAIRKVFGKASRTDIEACAEMVEKALGHRWDYFVDYVTPVPGGDDDDGELPWSGLDGDQNPNIRLFDPFAEVRHETDF